MQKLNKLYQTAKENGITVLDAELSTKNAFCGLSDDNKWYIFIDKKKVDTLCKEKEVLAEEIAHCEIGAMYELSELDNPLQYVHIITCEHKARCEAIKLLIAPEQLVAVCNQCCNLFEVSEELNLDAEYVKSAIEYYETCNVILLQNGKLYLNKKRVNYAEYSTE